jgi:hypothetical protein
MKKAALLLVFAWAFGSADLRADQDGAFLDRPYRSVRKPIVNDRFDDQSELHGFNPRFNLALPVRSDAAAVARAITPVRSQGSRGTCSIFSATGLLEAMMVLKKSTPRAKADYSEEWLQYLVTRNRSDDGSNSTTNFRALFQYGTVPEALMPYIGETWESASYGLAQERCGDLKALRLKSCLIGHRDPALLGTSDAELTNRSGSNYDPEFAKARSAASAFRSQFFASASAGSGFYVPDTRTVKQLLAAGIPLTLDLDFFYGAWNHRKAEELGMKRNLDHWAKGIVGYPAPGSVDREASYSDPAGHSVLVVGYDDSVQVTVPTLMQGGAVRDLTYKGVYYFKNSWGTGSFGTDTQFGGGKFPGYGVITQKYAHDFGGFYELTGF